MALTPLIVALVRPSASAVHPGTPRTARSAFFLGLLTGVGYFAGTLYWLVETMTTFGGLPMAVALPVAGLLVAYLSLFPAAFAVAIARLRRSLGVPTAVLCAAPVWVASELGRQYVWDGFPWALARIQPGDRAADRAARERDRRLWPVVPACADVGGGGSADCGEAGPHRDGARP